VPCKSGTLPIELIVQNIEIIIHTQDKIKMDISIKMRHIFYPFKEKNA